jgi:hypothetical protein
MASAVARLNFTTKSTPWRSPDEIEKLTIPL